MTSMEDNLNGRQPQWKTTLMEDGEPQWKMTTIEDDHNGRQPQWKTTSMEDNLNGRQPIWKTTSMEDDINGRQPQANFVLSLDQLSPSLFWFTFVTYVNNK